MAAAFSQVDRNLINASSTLGASALRTFFRIILPLSINGVITGIVLSFAQPPRLAMLRPDGPDATIQRIGDRQRNERSCQQGKDPKSSASAIRHSRQALDYAGANRMAFIPILARRDSTGATGTVSRIICSRQASIVSFRPVAADRSAKVAQKRVPAQAPQFPSLHAPPIKNFQVQAVMVVAYGMSLVLEGADSTPAGLESVDPKAEPRLRASSAPPPCD